MPRQSSVSPPLCGGVIFLLLSTTIGLRAQSTQPATNPADVDAAKQSLYRLSTALRDGDVATIIALVDAPTSASAKVVAAMARFDGGLAELHRATAESFGEEKAAAVVGDTNTVAEQSLAAIDSAQVRIDGDAATITYPAGKIPPAQLVRVGKAWKVHLKQLDALASPAAAEAATDQFDHLTIAARRVAKDIRQMKYKNVDKAAEAWRSGMMQAVSENQPATQPAP